MRLKIEVRAIGLKAMREKGGLTQRKLAHDLGISQNYIPAIEAGARRAGPKVQAQMMKYFGVPFEELCRSRVSRSRDQEGTGAAAQMRSERLDQAHDRPPSRRRSSGLGWASAVVTTSAGQGCGR